MSSRLFVSRLAGVLSSSRPALAPRASLIARSLSTFPSDRKYVKSHEWVKMEEGVATIGITDHAQDALGEIVHAELPQVGDDTKNGTPAAALESVKAAADIYAPVSGKVIATNEKVEETPKMINTSPHEEWLFKVEVSDASPIDALMSASEYEATLEDK